jgi:hypothetical protein
MGAGDRAFWADIADLVRPPMIKLIAVGTQSIPDNVATAIAFGAGSEELTEDVSGWHSTTINNTRVTPTKAGVYRVRGTVMNGSRSDYSDVNCWIRKNGASNIAPAARNGWQGIAAASVESQPAETLIRMNGTTDYVELISQQNNVANVAQITNSSGQYTSVLEVEYRRP